MSATEVSGAGRKFQVERGGGRLRLHLVGAAASAAAYENVEEEEEEDEEEEETGEEREGHDAWGGEDMKGNCEHAGGEYGTGKQLSRPSRCLGWSREMARWGSVTSVATS